MYALGPQTYFTLVHSYPEGLPFSTVLHRIHNFGCCLADFSLTWRSTADSKSNLAQTLRTCDLSRLLNFHHHKTHLFVVSFWLEVLLCSVVLKHVHSLEI